MKVVVLGTRGIPEVQGGVETHCQNLYPRLVNSAVPNRSAVSVKIRYFAN